MSTYQAPQDGFAKIFGHGNKQILVIREESDEGKPAIAIHANADMGRVVIRPMWEDSDNGATNRDLLFDKIHEQAAKDYLIGASKGAFKFKFQEK
jgi:hypothetical protein